MPRWTPQTLGPWLKELRENAGFSHDRLGERVERSRQQLIEYEQGKRDPGATVLLNILDEVGARIEPPLRSAGPGSLAEELHELRARFDRVVDDLAARERPGVVVAQLIVKWRYELGLPDSEIAGRLGTTVDVVERLVDERVTAEERAILDAYRASGGRPDDDEEATLAGLQAEIAEMREELRTGLARVAQERPRRAVPKRAGGAPQHPA